MSTRLMWALVLVGLVGGSIWYSRQGPPPPTPIATISDRIAIFGASVNESGWSVTANKNTENKRDVEILHGEDSSGKIKMSFYRLGEGSSLANTIELVQPQANITYLFAPPLTMGEPTLHPEDQAPMKLSQSSFSSGNGEEQREFQVQAQMLDKEGRALLFAMALGNLGGPDSFAAVFSKELDRTISPEKQIAALVDLLHNKLKVTVTEK